MSKIKCKIKKGDTVIVLAGKDKGRVGEVRKMILDQDRQQHRVIVEGANLVKKHIKPNPNKGIEGGIKEQEASLHISNIALVNPITGKAEKVGYKHLEDAGKTKVRFFKKSNELVETAS